MIFSSIIFLFLFLPLTIVLYFLIGKKLHNILLLFASLFFYAWGEGFFIIILLASIIVNYSSGLLIERFRSNKLSKLTLLGAIVLNLGLLCYWKYDTFIIENINYLLSLVEYETIIVTPVHLPIGISFFTFSALSYVIDVYCNKTNAQRSFIDLALYISFFPKLIAGPIVRYVDVAEQIRQRTITANDFAEGVQRFIFGLGKKVLIADTLASPVNQIFSLPAQELTLPITWLGIACYTLQIYFDFSGYSDMAIGIGRMFGFTFLENFNFPYISQSIQEFWRRWHISLATWFRDYLYFPLGGSRQGSIKTYLNLMTVFFFVGLWHGASWNYVIWGLFHGLFLVLERFGLSNIIKKVGKPLRHTYVILVVFIGWVFFRAETFQYAINFISVMFGIQNLGVQNKVSMYMDLELALTVLVAVICSTPILGTIRQLRQYYLNKFSAATTYFLDIFYESARMITLVAILVLSVIYLAGGTYNPFIYFKF